VALNQREKKIAIILGVILGGYAVYAYAIDPYMSAVNEVHKNQAAATSQINAAHHLFLNRKSVSDEWKTMMANGLETTPSAAELRVLPEITQWAENLGVHIDSHKTDSPNQSGDFQQMRITVTGNGTITNISHLIFDIETSKLPVQISDCRIFSKKADGSDDLDFQLSVSTLIFAPPQSTTKPAARPTGGSV
jgi:hypothetical protein